MLHVIDARDSDAGPTCTNFKLTFTTLVDFQLTFTTLSGTIFSPSTVMSLASASPVTLKQGRSAATRSSWRVLPQVAWSNKVEMPCTMALVEQCANKLSWLSQRKKEGSNSQVILKQGRSAPTRYSCRVLPRVASSSSDWSAPGPFILTVLIKTFSVQRLLLRLVSTPTSPSQVRSVLLA